jgi:hypothetical protein
VDTSNAVFISYRRKVGGLWALAMYQALTRHPTEPVDVFYDVESLQHAGNFNERLLAQIESRPYFIVVLTPATLDRCVNKGDWLRREIEHAVATRRLIVPAFTPGFDVGDFTRFLPPAAASELSSSQGLDVSEAFFTEAMARLRDKLLVTVPLTSVAMGDDDEAYRRRAIEAVEAEPAVTPRELEERELAQQSLGAADDAEEMSSIAGRSAERAAGVLHQRALIREAQNDLGDAIADMRRAAETDPADRRHADELARLLARRSERRRRLVLGMVAAIVAVALGGILLARALDDSGSETARSILRGGERLQRGESLESEDGDTELEFTSDGMLVASTDDREWWLQPAEEPAGEYAELQTDGNFVVYEADGETPVWATATDDHRGASLRVETIAGRGVIAVYDPDGALVWGASEGAPDERSMLRSEERLERGDRLMSADGRHALALTQDGELVATTDGDEWWRASTEGPGAYAVMQEDGNFVVRTRDHAPVWHSATHGNPRAYLVVDGVGDRGTVTIYDHVGHVIWREQSSDRVADAPQATHAGTAGTVVDTVSTVVDTASTVQVPDVTGRDATEAEVVLADAGLVARFRERSSAEPPGVVIDQQPSAASTVRPGSTVDVVVSSGSSSTTSTTGV